MRLFVFRRPEFLLLAALAVLAVALYSRSTVPQTMPAPQTGDVQQINDAPAPLPVSSERSINLLKAQLRENPDNVTVASTLGLALLQRVRETGDVSLYGQAEQVLQTALSHDPRSLDALIGMGSLANARHQFSEALTWGEKARDVSPYRAAVYGVITDALTELGRYEEAAAAADKMVKTRPDLASYSRVAYQRELRGNIAGAAQALELAISAGGSVTEHTVWTQVQLGNLAFNTGDLERASAIYTRAIAISPNDAYAQAGLARVAAAQGEIDSAIATYSQIVTRLPLPEFVIALGELYEASGEMTKANQQYDLVRAMQKLNAGAGMDVDLELALFEADHGGDPQQALAMARTAYKHRPSIHAADALAWALGHAGQPAEAARYSAEALQLGTIDAAMYYRAGVIAQANGDDGAARNYLTRALDINPHFSVLHAPSAQAMLAQLQ